MTSTDQMLHADGDVLLSNRDASSPGEKIVFVAGQPVGLRGSTNMLKLHRIGGIRKLVSMYDAIAGCFLRRSGESRKM